MSVGTLSPVGRQVFLWNGAVIEGGLVYFSESGSSFATAPLPVYTDAALSVAWSNPMQLDADGGKTFYLLPTSYRMAVHDADDALLYTVDPVTSVNSGTLIGGSLGDVFDFQGDPTSPIVDTSYPVGATYDKCHAGTRFFTLDSDDLAAGTYVLSAMGQMASAGTLSVAIVNLTDGAPDTPLATVSITSLVGEVAVSSAITFPAGGASKTFAIKVKVSTASGAAWGIALQRTA